MGGKSTVLMRGISFWTFFFIIHSISDNSIVLPSSGRKAMFVSNHNSWMDIPFLGHVIGWHNYKFVAKKELEKVPILGKAIKVAENVLVDRSNRKSQLLTLKQGIKWLDVSAVVVSICRILMPHPNLNILIRVNI